MASSRRRRSATCIRWYSACRRPSALVSSSCNRCCALMASRSASLVRSSCIVDSSYSVRRVASAYCVRRDWSSSLIALDSASGGAADCVVTPGSDWDFRCMGLRRSSSSSSRTGAFATPPHPAWFISRCQGHRCRSLLRIPPCECLSAATSHGCRGTIRAVRQRYAPCSGERLRKQPTQSVDLHGKGFRSAISPRKSANRPTNNPAASLGVSPFPAHRDAPQAAEDGPEEIHLASLHVGRAAGGEP